MRVRWPRSVLVAERDEPTRAFLVDRFLADGCTASDARRFDASRRELFEQELGGGPRTTGHGADR